MFFIRMDRFRGVHAEHTDFFIFSVISDHDGISVNNPDHLILAGKGNRGNDDEKEGQKMNDFKGSIHTNLIVHYKHIINIAL